MTPAAMFPADVAAWLLGRGVTLGMAGLARVRNDQHAWALLDEDTFHHQTEEKT